MKELIERLSEYGLTDKESLVYMAMLELGPSSVQDIAKKAGVNRATTYVMIEALKKRGLMSTFEKGRKTMFVAESPEKLKQLAEKEVKVVQEKAERLHRSLPLFMALFNSASASKPMVKFYEGQEGVSTCREMIGQSRGEVLNFVARDESSAALSKLNEEERLELTRKVYGRKIVAIKPGTPRPNTVSSLWQRRTIPYEQFPFTGDMVFFDDKILIFFMHEIPHVFLIESHETYEMLKALFELAWMQAKPEEMAA